MELRDRFDLPITSASAEAVGDYVAAVDLLLSANPGAEQRLARASANDPDFALAHTANARLLQLRGRMPEARAAAGAGRGASRPRLVPRKRTPRCNRGRGPGLRDGSSGFGALACGGI